ncbi:MAG: 4Fe-4S dicluster domain-containing protein [Hadesarchaea archaeon]|nr:MAG: 4Fe-4S dicluster domain-containing protein [Hadesarchaea archaeon]
MSSSSARKKLPPGAVILKAGSTVQTETGSWRSLKPVIDEKKCTGCGLCWLYCPDTAISKDKPPKIDYKYCKGCGICASECPVEAIIMVAEGEK